MSAVSQKKPIGFDEFDQFDFRTAEVTQITNDENSKMTLSYGKDVKHEVAVPKSVNDVNQLVGQKILTVINMNSDSGTVIPMIFFDKNKLPVFFGAEAVESNTSISMGDFKKKTSVVSKEALNALDLKIAKVVSQKNFDDCLELKIDFGNQQTSSVVLPDGDPSLQLEGKKILTIANLKRECFWDPSVAVIAYKKQGITAPFLPTSDIQEGIQF
jgi:tRNA-binding EMAP/Myf-like protein